MSDAKIEVTPEMRERFENSCELFTTRNGAIEANGVMVFAEKAVAFAASEAALAVEQYRASLAGEQSPELAEAEDWLRSIVRELPVYRAKLGGGPRFPTSADAWQHAAPIVAELDRRAALLAQQYKRYVELGSRLEHEQLANKCLRNEVAQLRELCGQLKAAAKEYLRWTGFDEGNGHFDKYEQAEKALVKALESAAKGGK